MKIQKRVTNIAPHFWKPPLPFLNYSEVTSRSPYYLMTNDGNWVPNPDYVPKCKTCGWPVLFVVTDLTLYLHALEKQDGPCEALKALFRGPRP